MKTIHIKIYGHVQGVGFRYYTTYYANQFDISGTVQNVYDFVEIYATGEHTTLTAFTEKVIHGASPMSRVSSYEINELPYQSFNNFRTL
ncbi:acylphosphatase [Macrococcoides caseolyticum]|uniref:acylphosphatase n=1 Tax=Macrococcoides caseolyticum TaxID=69966 RepID=UPI001F290613|nr:acylphosphatase [Macrococcus caseolyticus]MCE4957001.1 acylphosphatase [Macrococcus caseolyticus]